MEQTRNVEATKLAVRHYTEQMKLDRWSVGLALLLPALGNILTFYVPPLIVAHVLVVFSRQSHPDLTSFVPYIFLFGAIWLTGEAFWRLGINFLIKSETRGMERLYVQAMAFLLEKDLAFFHNNFAGSLTKKVTGYSRKYEDLMDALTFNIAAEYLPIPFVVFILWQFSPWLVAGLLGLLAMTAMAIFPLIKRRQKIVAAREAASNVAAGYVADMIGNIDAIKSFAHEDYEIKNHRHKVGEYISMAKKSWDYQNRRIDVTTSPFYVLTNVVGLVLAIWLGNSHGSQTLAAVFVTFTYYVGVTRVVWEFNQVYRNIESALTEGAQFTELLLDEPSLKDPVKPKPLKVKAGAIEFRDVHFNYSDSQGNNLFEELNLKIQPGEKVAFVGHSGGGKTTITRLLLRFMDVDDGQILIDGQNIAEISQHDLRSVIAYVPQEPAMFHRSLADNIRYGKLKADDKAVRQAARAAHAAEFIDKLPKGYETLVGERGVKLSGGQRQRIAIARAMIKDAPILVLDEATSALDSESEKLIQAALWNLMEGRTAIVIAHRLSTIARMDRIVVLENGQIVEQGSHKELLKNNGIYAGLWTHQSGGFIEE